MNNFAYLLISGLLSLFVTAAAHTLPASNAKRFVLVLLINVLALAFPWYYVGMIMGLPSAILSAVCITYLIRSEK